LSFSMTWTII